MVYWQFLILFGLLPLGLLLFVGRRRLWKYKGTFLWAVLGVMWVSVPWEAVSVDRIWYYSSGAILGWRILGIPIEEYAFFALDALLITTLALLLRRGGGHAPD